MSEPLAALSHCEMGGLGLFPDPDGGEVRPAAAWNPDITHRQRVLLHAEPLFRMLRADAHLTEDKSELGHYDSLALSLKIIDVILESTGLEDEIASDEIVHALTPLLAAMDAAAGVPPDAARHLRMTERVMGWLLNEDERKAPFRVPYMDFDESGSAVRRSMDVELLSERFDASGRAVPRLSAEATNLYLNALKLDIQDQQIAVEAIIQAQLARGRFVEAVRSARSALLLSIQLREELEGVLRDTRRDVRRVDWSVEIPERLRIACEHVNERTRTERNIVASAEEKLNALPGGTSEARHVAQVIRLVDQCSKHHAALETRLIEALPVFLEEQSRQAYVSRASYAAPDLRAEVLLPLLRLSRAVALSLADELIAAFTGPQVPAVFDLGWTIERLLQPRREARSHSVAVDERTLIDVAEDPLRFEQGVWDATDRILGEVRAPTPLSDLLMGAEYAGEGGDVLDLLAMRALFLFSPGEEYAGRLRARRTGDTFTLGHRFGDDLILFPASDDDAAAP